MFFSCSVSDFCSSSSVSALVLLCVCHTVEREEFQHVPAMLLEEGILGISMLTWAGGMDGSVLLQSDSLFFLVLLYSQGFPSGSVSD